MGPDDRILLRRTHAGHDASARELWQRHAGWMLAFARVVLGRRNQAGAEDVVQATFCQLLTLDRRTIQAVREVRPWLATLVRRQALNDLRSARRAAKRDRRRPPPTESRPPGDAEVAQAMAQLPRRLREVLYLRHVAGLSTDQTALALGIPRGTVASRHHAAVDALRLILESHAPTAPESRGGPVHAHAI